MQFGKTLVATLLAGTTAIDPTLAAPTHQANNNGTITEATLEARLPQEPEVPLPPLGERIMLDQMNISTGEGRALPECAKTCMLQKNGKTSIHLDTMSVDDFCQMGRKWVLASLWLTVEVTPCTRHECHKPRKAAQKATNNWMIDTCGKI